MKINLKATNIELEKNAITYIDEKIKGLAKFLEILKEEGAEKKTIAEVWVEVGKETRHHKKGPFFFAEAQLHLPGKSIRARAITDNLKKSVNKVKDELEIEIKKYKLKPADLAKKRKRELGKINEFFLAE